MSEKTCIDCPAPITAEALALNPSGLWCVKCERERRARLDRQFATVTKSFEETDHAQ